MTHNSSFGNGHVGTATVSKHAATQVASKYDANPSGIVVGLTLSLSWQLAIVVLVPILGGHFLDDRLKSSPWLTLAGFAIAMISMVLVLRKTLKQLNEYMKPTDEAPASEVQK